MNATVNSQVLAAELRLLNKVVRSKPAIAILSHALMTAGARLQFCATDLEVGLATSCPATIHAPGVVALPVAKLLALVEQFADSDVTIALDKQHVTVTCGAFISRLQVLPVDDFPKQPEPSGPSATLDAETLRRLIAKTRYAVCAAGSRYVLQGALLTLAGPVAAMVATDSKRLAISTGTRTGPDLSMIIPAKALDMLGQGDAGDVEVTVGAQTLFFAQGVRMLTSRMLTGMFPAYERIIPRANDKVLTIDRSLITAALRRVVLIAEETEAVRCEIAPGVLSLSSASAGVGSADEQLRVGYDGAPLTVYVNGRYALDFLNAATGQTVTLSLKDSTSPALFADGADYLAVIMTMKG